MSISLDYAEALGAFWDKEGSLHWPEVGGGNPMPDDLMTLTMTREVFPHFKRLLESTRLPDGDELVQFAVGEGEPGVIEIEMIRWGLGQERG